MWQDAIDAEINAILANNTYVIVKRPKDRVVLPSMIILKKKLNAIGQVEKRKARFVAKGCAQVPGIDYFEISSPVARLTTARAVFASSAYYDWDMQQIDINIAFLLGDLPEEVYCEQPEGYEIGGDNKHDYVCLLKKSLHGLKQAPYVWHQTLKAALVELGYTISYSDASMFHVKGPEGKSYAVVYVDDFIISGPDKLLNDKLKHAILTKFKGKDLGEPTSFFGMHIQRDRTKKTIKLSNPRHISELLHTYKMDQAHISPIPMSKDLPLDRYEDSELIGLTKVPCRQLVDSLLYVAMTTRPDIAYAVGILSRYMSKPYKVHWKAAQCVLRYLKGTESLGIVFGNATNDCNLNLTGYCDSDHAGDKVRGHSTYGYAFVLNGASIGWRSKNQDFVVKSTNEAGIVAASLTTTEAL